MPASCLSRRSLLVFSGGALTALTVSGKSPAAAAPRPWGALPAPRQLLWHKLETYGFLHFTVNTFTDREWGLGDEDPKIFNPTDFNADQIVTACKAGGLKQLILTAKHHDGFCLWPSRYTEHSIKNSPFQNGKGDIVRDISRACARHGIKFGIYLSPWDRNHAEYARPAYVEYYIHQLQELLTRYGKIWEVWFDGANGGDGYYGGARETRHIDAKTYYQWDRIRKTVRTLQPDAVMMADAGMDVRWVGNEQGIAGDPCWPTVDTSPYTQEKGNRGVRGGPVWDPAEADVSIRPGWFWHADENDQVRSPANLLDLYLKSVGRGSSLLLNVPPNRRGRISETDAKNLAAFHNILRTAYARNFASGAKVTASSVFSSAHTAAAALKGPGYWAAREDDRAGAWLQLDLAKTARFDLIRLCEELPLGVRVDDYEIDIAHGNGWQSVAKHTCIGPQRLIRLAAPVTTDKIRLRITKAAASPCISEFSLFLLPDVVDAPQITRDRMGRVTLTAPGGGAIRYTTNGTPPTQASPLYHKPFVMAEGGEIRAIACSPRSTACSSIATGHFDIAPARWHAYVNGTPAPALISGKGVSSASHQPLTIIIDLGKTYPLKGFTLTPAKLNTPAEAARCAPPAAFTVWVSDDDENWGKPVMADEFSNIAVRRSAQKVHFARTVSGRFLRLTLPRAVEDKPVIMVGDIGVLTK